MLNGSYAQRDIRESERGNDVSNPTGGEWSLVAPTAKLYQRYLRAWLDPDAHTKHNRDNSCMSCHYQDDTDAIIAATGDGFVSSQENYVRAWEKLSEREHEHEKKQRHQKQQQH